MLRWWRSYQQIPMVEEIARVKGRPRLGDSIDADARLLGRARARTHQHGRPGACLPVWLTSVSMPWPTARNALVRTTAALPTPPRYEYIQASNSAIRLYGEEKLGPPREKNFLDLIFRSFDCHLFIPPPALPPPSWKHEGGGGEGLSQSIKGYNRWYRDCVRWACCCLFWGLCGGRGWNDSFREGGVVISRSLLRREIEILEIIKLSDIFFVVFLVV